MKDDGSGVTASREDIPPPRSLWLLLWAIAFASRLAAAFFLPNAEQDGYSYAESIGQLSARIAAGDLHVANLFGFWLPLFQAVSAIPNLWIHNPLVAGKLINFGCGAASCVLVFALTEKLTRSRILAWLTFILIVLTPLHILYSAACMTDVPHVCMLLASLWCVIRRRWIGAAVFGAIAESFRIEAWSLLLVLPLIQLIWERRLSILVIAILLAPPISWLAINYCATGDPFAYFNRRALYHADYIDFHPTRRYFVFADIQQDISYFGLGANWMVFFGSIAAGCVLISQAISRVRRVCQPALAVAGYSAAILGVLFLAYVTKRQPVILPRYGLASFCLGLPLFAWILQAVVERTNHRWLALLFATLVVVLTLFEMKPQLPNISKVIDDFQAQQRIAQTLDVSLSANKQGSLCFSDDVAVRVLSHQPPTRFLRSELVPPSASTDSSAFGRYLREQHVSHLIFFRTESSLPVKLYPQLGKTEQSTPPGFELVDMARSTFGPDIWLYRVGESDR